MWLTWSLKHVFKYLRGQEEQRENQKKQRKKDIIRTNSLKKKKSSTLSIYTEGMYHINTC